MPVTQPYLLQLTKKKRPLALSIGLVVCFCGLLITLALWSIWSARERHLEESATSTQNMARALAAHAETSVKLADAILGDISERIRHDGLGPAARERLQRHLAQNVSNVPELYGLFVYGPDGRWLVTSLPDSAYGNNSDRQYFQYHATHRTGTTQIGAPVRSRSTGLWIIPVSRRIENADGSFAGVVLATLRINFFVKYYESFDIGHSGTIFLGLDNGTLILRRPLNEKMIGSSIAKGPVYQLYKSQGPVGTAMLRARFDNVERLYSYRHLEGFPLIVAVARSKDEILANWRASSVKTMALILALTAALGFAGYRIVRQIIIRDELEQELRVATASLQQRNFSLTELALSDALTGVANRRHFDESLRREFSRAERNGSVLAVILVDVDFFKRFNDLYGHVAGDDCLRAVAKAIASGSSRPADLAARYGGEEFAVILPDTDLAGAVAVAERIRAAAADLNVVHSGSPAGIVTISSGIYAGIPKRDGCDDELSFLERADKALYEAKLAGRNTVVGWVDPGAPAGVPLAS